MGRKFYRALKALAAKLGCHPQDLLAVMMLESGCSPAAFNKTSSAVGLIQFMPVTLHTLGYQGTVFDFQKLSAWEQMPWVEKYFDKVATSYGPLTTLTRLYCAVLCPAALMKGNGDDVTLYADPSVQYTQNKGLDLNQDGRITLGDIRKYFDGVTARPDYDRLLGELMFENVVWAPDVIAEVALRYVDCGRQLDVDRYLEVMCSPNASAEERRYMMAGPSTCALFARGVWRIAGVESGILTSPYRIGQAVSDVMAIATAHDAWHPNPTMLQKGDVVLLTNPEHVFVCVSDPRPQNDTSFEIDTVEGGQTGPGGGSSYVKRFARGLEIKNKRLVPRGGKYQSWVIGRADACTLLLPAPYPDA